MSWSAFFDFKAQSVGDFVFFRLILEYLHNEIQKFGIEMLGRVMALVGAAAFTMVMLWILLQGYRIATGQSRDSLMVLVMNSLKVTLIITIATTMAMFGGKLHDFLTTDLKNEINYVVTGDKGGPEQSIDKNLAWMQVALSSIDVLDVAESEVIDEKKTRALYMVGLGTGGPAIVGGTMLILYEIALALFVGLGPIFIMCLAFDQTKQLFSKWLYYGIGTMFSMAVLSGMVSIALEMVARVAASFWGTAAAGLLLQSNFSDGLTSQAMQQGGMGLILTTLIITAPPMAAAFFQGTMGHFTPGSVFGGGSGAGVRDVSGRLPGQGGYLPPPATPATAPARPLNEGLIGVSQPAQRDVIRPEPYSPNGPRYG